MSHPSPHRMIVPQFWAEARLQQRTRKKQVTVRRFGWSDTSAEEAQAHAESRAQEALQQAMAGSRLLRREPKVAYNGAHGVPIREEILSRHGDVVITRNGYGAHCLNTPNVLFADIDLAPEGNFSGRHFLWGVAVIVAAGILLGASIHSARAGVVFILVGMLFSIPLSLRLNRFIQTMQGGAMAVVRRNIHQFLLRNPGWKLRLYQTPAGLRVMAVHATFTPDDPQVSAFFRAVGTDKVYHRMCSNQQCFRARLTAKPWRIGIEGHMKPRPGTWPVAAEKMPMRQAWVEAYEAKASGFAACRFMETLGNGITHPDVQAVQQLHDELSGALSQKPLA